MHIHIFKAGRVACIVIVAAGSAACGGGSYAHGGSPNESNQSPELALEAADQKPEPLATHSSPAASSSAAPDAASNCLYSYGGILCGAGR